MKRFCLALALAVLALASVGILTRNQLIKLEARRLIAEQTGFDLEIGELRTFVFSSRAELKNVVVRNPPEFPERTALIIDRASVEVNPWALFRKETHLRALEVEIPRAIVVRNAEGVVNFQRFADAAQKQTREKETAEQGRQKPGSLREPPSDGRIAQAPPPPADSRADSPSHQRTFRIDRFLLRLDKVEFHDYAGREQPSVTVVDLQLRREMRDITKPSQVGEAISAAVIESVASRLSNQLFRSLQQAAEEGFSKESLKRVGRDLKRSLKSIIQGASAETEQR